ncbi:hypothetical protein DY000_02017702 [Brassica cretica]|uniref:Fcf2 pre-rRNA processing C-terminal domain-containing protein n=1 Tax=Brassica cretica TaxID=69181 RepID=A0ABQ7CXN9_BRACR|nr:hypothetical protein DY000_02017702 [Brassica cretica]
MSDRSLTKPESVHRKLESGDATVGLVDGLCLPPTDPKKKFTLYLLFVDWFDMPAPTMTPELKRDLQLLKLRDVMDPKTHYKRVASQSNLAGKYFQASL